MDVDILSLTCWIRFQDPKATFRVKISKAGTVFDLQEAIKNEKLTFRGVDDALDLYTPKDPLFLPFGDHLRQLNLLAHGKFLEGVQELSEVFPEPLPKSAIHVIVDPPISVCVCWLRGVNSTLDSGFQVKVPRTGTVLDLQRAIKSEKPAIFRDVEADSLRLFKILGSDDELRESLNEMGDGEPLRGIALAPILSGVPVLNPLLVVVEVSPAGGSPTLVQHPLSGGHHLRDYEDIFLKVKNWGKLDYSDIGRNRIVKVESMVIPDFVTTFVRKLVRTPRLPVDPPELHTLDAPRTYFRGSEDSIAEDGSQEEVRSADLLEVMHTAYHVASYQWQKCWQRCGSRKRPLKEHLVDLIFFGVFLMAEHRTAAVLKDEDWRITVVVKRDNASELRQYCPRSDFLISNSTLPRLLVEVNSTSQDSWPTDLIRMLTTGAFVVRFANKFLSMFREKNFVLCAIFIWADGAATRYTLFQNQNDESVYYNEVQLSLDHPDGRAEFAHYLYNLLSVELDQDQDSTTKGAIRELNSKIEERQLKSFYTRDPTGGGSRKRPRTGNNGDDGAGGGGGDDRAQFRAHGYEVEPEVTVDTSGGKWKPLSQTPDHIRTLYRPSNPNEEFIAKKIRKKSNELEIFRFLNSIPLKSDHIISLVDSFNGWAITRKMTTVEDYVAFRAIPEAFERKISQVCLGLIKGVTYLHEHRIAHRDIKPDNLVVDKNYNLKIIDFDIAMRVEDEDEEVDDQRGTQGWMAPEADKRHSPIKADRWACGRVLQSLLDEFGKNEGSLRVFARDLTAYNPKQRPSMLDWGRYSALPLLDAGNLENSHARKARRDRMEVDEDTRPPDVKKQRLELGQYGMGVFPDRHGLGLGLKV